MEHDQTQNNKTVTFKKEVSVDEFEDKFKTHAGIYSVQTIFGEIRERNVVFCIDTSGSMYTTIKTVKEHLIETLLKHAFKEGSTKFNVLACNNKVKALADQLVDCTPQSVMVAADWIGKMEIGSSMDMLPALIAAFQSTDVDSVYLVTDSHSCDKNREVLLDHIEYICRGRPVHCLYVTDKPIPDRTTAKFLESIAEVTCASFRIAAVTTKGALQCVRPIYISPQCQKPPLKSLVEKNGFRNPRISIACQIKGDPLMESVFTNPSVVQDPLNEAISPFYHPYNHWFWPGLPSLLHLTMGSQKLTPYYELSRYRPSRAFLQGRDHLTSYEDDQFLTPSAGAMVVGRNLLAQRDSDGLFYSVYVKSQLGPCGFLLEFPPNSTSGDRPTYQESTLLNTLSVEDALRHPLSEGDFVLAPRGDGAAYHPAKVISGKETRDPLHSRESKRLQVKWHDDLEETLDLNKAVWISQPFYNRAVKYLQDIKENHVPQSAEMNYSLPATKYSKDGYGSQPVHQNCSTLTNIENRGKSASCITGGNFIAPFSDMPVFPRGTFSKDRIKIESTKEEIEKKAAEDDFTPVKRLEYFDLNSNDEREDAYDDTSVEREEDGKRSQTFGSRLQSNLKKTRQKTFITGEDTETDEEVDDTARENSVSHTRSQSLVCNSWLRNIDRPIELPPRIRRSASPKQKRKVSPERPAWRYWSGDKIPNILDPPIFEPYQPPKDLSESIGGKQLYQGHFEASSPAFNLLRPGDITYNDPQRMYALFHHKTHQPTPFAQRDATVGRDSIDPWMAERNRWERKTRYQHHGYPNAGNNSIPTEDSVSQLIHDNHEARIHAQIERDRLNRATYQEQMDKRNNEIMRKITEKYSSKQTEIPDKGEDAWMKDPAMMKLHAERARKQLCTAN